jgi:hypothetical protein
MNFSFKKEKVEVVEKYIDNAVLTYIGGIGVKKFALNNKAVVLLGLSEFDAKDRKISFGPTDDTILIANTSKVETMNQHVINSDFTFASAPLAKQLTLAHDLVMEAGMEFPLVTSVEDEYPHLVISKLNMQQTLELNEVITDTTDARNEVASEEEVAYDTTAYDENPGIAVQFQQ